jgi:hypothetical protein
MVTEDDRQLMRAVINGLWHPLPDRTSPLGRILGSTQTASRRSLVFDTTISYCGIDPIVERPAVRGCLGAPLLRYFRTLPRVSGPVSEALFRRRNARSRPIGGALGDDVDFIPSATVVTSLELDTFLRGRAWSPVLVFSRPVYVGTSAAIFYRAIHAGGGFVLLDRRDGAWSITTTEGWLE